MRTVIAVLEIAFLPFFIIILVCAFFEGIDMTFLAPIRARKKVEEKMAQWRKDHQWEDKK